MKRLSYKIYLRVFIVHCTGVVLFVDCVLLLLFVRQFGREWGIRGSDLFVLLFVFPYNLIVLMLWIGLLGPRLFPKCAPAVWANRHRLSAACIVGMLVWILVVFSPLVTRKVTLLHAIVGWVVVLGAFIIGYRWNPRFDKWSARTNDRPLAPQPPLPSRHLPKGMTPVASIPPALEELDNSPMRLLPTGITNRDLVQTGETCFIARPGLSQRLASGAIGLFLAGAMIGIIHLIITNNANRGPIETIACIAVLSLIAAIGFFHALAAIMQDGTVEFDVQQDRVTYGLRWSRKSLALSDVVAVQFLMVVPRRASRRRDKGDKRCSFQVNLLTTDVREPRINVAQSFNIRWSNDAAKRIAAALGVPLIDQVFSSTAKRGQ